MTINAVRRQRVVVVDVSEAYFVITVIVIRLIEIVSGEIALPYLEKGVARLAAG